MATATKISPDEIKNMNAAQLRTEIKSHFEAAAEIEKKYPDRAITDAEDEKEIKRLLQVIDQMEDALTPLEQADERKARISQGLQAYSTPTRGMQHARTLSPEEQMFLKSPGQQFIESPEFKGLIDRGLLRNNSTRVEATVAMKGSLIERKAIINTGSSSAGGFVQNDYVGFRVPLLQRELTVIDLIGRGQTDSDTIEYTREDTFTNAAAPVAEATATTGTSGLKPESTFAYSNQTATVRTIAHWVPVTNRMLSDARGVRSIIDNRLLLGLDLTLESQIITGDGTGENFTGIVNAASINVQGLGTDNVMDAIYKGRTLVRTTGKSRPTGVVVNSSDWQKIRLSRENAATGTLGGYLMGPPSQQGPTTLWGLPVVESEGIAVGTALVGDFAMGAMLFDREEAQVRVGFIDDQFVRNMQTLLAELRAAFVVWRGAAFAKVTGI